MRWSQRRHFSAHVRDLPVHPTTYLCKEEAKLSMAGPPNSGLIHGERITFLRIDPALDRSSQRDSHGTRDAATRGRKVS